MQSCLTRKGPYTIGSAVWGSRTVASVHFRTLQWPDTRASQAEAPAKSASRVFASLELDNQFPGPGCRLPHLNPTLASYESMAAGCADVSAA